MRSTTSAVCEKCGKPNEYCSRLHGQLWCIACVYNDHICERCGCEWDGIMFEDDGQKCCRPCRDRAFNQEVEECERRFEGMLTTAEAIELLDRVYDANNQ